MALTYITLRCVTNTHSLSKGCTEPCHCMGEHLCHCCGNAYGESSSIFFQQPLINKMSMNSKMQIACCQFDCWGSVAATHFYSTYSIKSLDRTLSVLLSSTVEMPPLPQPCVSSCVHAMISLAPKCCFALLSLVSPVLLTLMPSQETFSILPQDRLVQLLSSGLKVSLYSLSSLLQSGVALPKCTAHLGFGVSFPVFLGCMFEPFTIAHSVRRVVIQPVYV